MLWKTRENILKESKKRGPGRPKKPEDEKLKMLSIRVNPVFYEFFKAWSAQQSDPQRLQVEEALNDLIEKRNGLKNAS